MSFFLWINPGSMTVVQEILENGLLGEKSKIDEERDPRLGNLVGTDGVSMIPPHPTPSQPSVARRN